MARVAVSCYTVPMVRIEIDIPRPSWLMLALVAGGVWVLSGMVRGQTSTRAELAPEDAAVTREDAASGVRIVETPPQDDEDDTYPREEDLWEDEDGSALVTPPVRPKPVFRESRMIPPKAPRPQEAASSSAPAQPLPGPAGGDDDASAVREAETRVQADRARGRVLEHRAEILRYQLALLESEAAEDPAAAWDLRARRAELLDLLQDQRAAETQLLSSLQQLWDANGFALLLTREPGDGLAPSVLRWPVTPALGISAHFHDSDYKTRFGFDHGAVDIPVAQGSVIRAPADGVVAKVTDNGMGFSSLTVKHAGGMATLYGHVSGFLVQEGQVVRAGDPIALSGGQPGTKGAGRITTGAHLHFEVYKDGEKVDPMGYLEKREKAE